MNLKYQNQYLILPADDGSREDTRLAVEYSDEAIQAFLEQGYVIVGSADFNKLIGNAEKPYSIHKDGTLYETPPYVPSLEEVKVAKKEEIKQYYLKDVASVVWVDHTDGNTYGYDTDKDSQVDFNSSYQRAKISGKTRYNVYVDKADLSQKDFVVHTPAMFELVLDKAGVYQEDVYAKYYMLKEKVSACSTPEEVEQIVW